MAKISTGPIVSDIRNKQGDVVFLRTHAGLATRNYFVPNYPGTPYQLSWAGVFSTVMTRYQTVLNDDQRHAWAEFGKRYPNHTSINGTRPLSPAQAYMRTNYPSQGNWGVIIDDPPENMNVVQPTGCAIITNTAAPQALTVQVYPHPTPAEIVIIGLTPPLSAGILKHWKYNVRLEWVPGPSAWPFNVYADWKAFYDARTPPVGTLVAGKRIGMLAYFMNLTNGALSQVAIADSITA